MPWGFPVTFAFDDLERHHSGRYEIENVGHHHATCTLPGVSHRKLDKQNLGLWTESPSEPSTRPPLTPATHSVEITWED